MHLLLVFSVSVSHTVVVICVLEYHQCQNDNRVELTDLVAQDLGQITHQPMQT